MGFYISGRDQPNLVAQCDRFPSPVMRRCACLHANEAGRSEEADYLRAPKVAADQNDAVTRDHVNF
ncbi:hypothetical protein IP68_15100 [Blastomonas sp. AAP25]|nr:hypothetical protein IP68_15100 [Blastomonas sp. AAP25]